MENLINKLSLLKNTMLSILKILLRSSRIKNYYSIKEKSLLILGNGPSLRTTIKKIKNREQFELCCVNNFPNTDLYQELHPEYFIIVSEQFFIQGSDKNENRFRQSMIDSYISKTTWPSTFLCPSIGKSHSSFLMRLKANRNITIRFFNTTPLEGFSCFKNWAMKKNLGSPRPHNVLIPSILVAINAGFKEIYLLGADHSWLPQISVNEKNEAMINQKHFYDENTSTSKQMKHQGDAPRKLHEILQKFVYSFRAYFELKSFALSRKATIYNATPHSFIDAFERINLDELE